ncbi:hypothetical protein ACB092_12G202800 [Castanea dentata]
MHRNPKKIKEKSTSRPHQNPPKADLHAFTAVVFTPPPKAEPTISTPPPHKLISTPPLSLSLCRSEREEGSLRYTDCCTWDGVQCDENTGHVIGPELSSSFLYGSINSSSSLFQLVHLKTLNPGGNNFNHSEIPVGVSFFGELPDSIGNLKSLYSLNVEGCNFSGPIPASFGNLTKLMYLDLSKFNISSPLVCLILSGTGFSGKLPGSIGNLKSLYSLGAERCNFSGPIPLSFANLTELLYLDLSNNNFSRGTFSWIGKQTKLTCLDIYATNFRGDIPFSLGNLTQLTMLNLGWNELTSTIPSWLANLTQLNNLWLTCNNFYGPIPKSISCLLNLQVLNFDFPGFLQNQDQLEVLELSQNKIHGQIPKWISNLSKDTLLLSLSSNKLQGSVPIPPPSIISYYVNNNMLGGEITHVICNLSSLSYLDFSYNNLSGFLPQCLGNLSNLSILNLEHNDFHGSIPQPFMQGCNLKMIYLNQNHFQGALPRGQYILVLSIGKPETNSRFPKLQVIHLSNNYITGKLPSEYFQIWKAMQSFEVGGLTYMQERIRKNYCKIIDFFAAIDLSSNTFEGEIPKIVGNLKALRMLNLSNNVLTVGEIPLQLAELTFLEFLNVSHNNLTGPITYGEQFSTFQNSSFEGNARLCGRQLSKQCTISKDSPPPSSSFTENQDFEFPFDFDWKVVVMGYGCGFIVGTFVG